MLFFKVKVHLNSADATWVKRATLVYDINHARPQSPPPRGPEHEDQEALGTQNLKF